MKKRIKNINFELRIILLYSMFSLAFCVVIVYI